MAIKQLGVAPSGTTDLTTKSYVDSTLLGSFVSSTVAIGNAVVTATGLSVTVPAGTWALYAYIPIVAVGTPASPSAVLSPSGGPTVTSLFYNFNRSTLTTTFAATGQSVVMPAAAGSHAFNQTCTMGSTIAAGTYVVELQGGMVSTTSGTISISMNRSGGTSLTVQKGAYLKVEKLA